MSDNKEKILESYPILPLRNTILFPNQIIPIYIGRQQSLDLISDISLLEKEPTVERLPPPPAVKKNFKKN